MSLSGLKRLTLCVKGEVLLGQITSSHVFTIYRAPADWTEFSYHGNEMSSLPREKKVRLLFFRENVEADSGVS